MKNKLLTGLLTIALLLPLGVKAETLDSVEEGSNSTEATVTVGEVETPVYEVSISWDTLKFNWVYDAETNSYGWSKGWDSPVSGNFDVPNGIYIYDKSTNGEIVPSLKWTSADGYEYVEGEFYYWVENQCLPITEEEFNENFRNLDITISSNAYSDPTCTTHLEDVSEYQEDIYIDYGAKKLTTLEVPDIARSYIELGLEKTPAYWYVLHLTLENKTESTTTPKAGDTIGTVTISIKAAE